MTFVRDGYLVRHDTVGKFRGRPPNTIPVRTWWLVKYSTELRSKQGIVQLQKIHLPAELVGKKVRFKIEIVDDDFVDKKPV